MIATAARVASVTTTTSNGDGDGDADADANALGSRLWLAMEGVANTQVHELNEETTVPCRSVLYSPVSLALLLACVRPETRGRSRALLDQEFRFVSAQEVTRRSEQMLVRWRKLSSSTFATVNVLLYDDANFDVDAMFLKRSSALSMQPPLPLSAWREANAAIASTTHGLFPRALERQPGGPFALINAMYLKTAWAHPFDANLTSLQPFSLHPRAARMLGRKQIDRPLMQQRGKRSILLHDKFTMLELESMYENGKSTFSMCFVLFDGMAADTPSMRDAMPLLLEANRTELVRRDVIHHIPKFTQMHATRWEPQSLQQADIGIVQRKKNDGAASEEPRPSWSLTQKAIVIVDEKGTEAAAFTAMTLATAMPPQYYKPPPPPLIFRADRPFFYFIRDTSSKVILAIGCYDGTDSEQ